MKSPNLTQVHVVVGRRRRSFASLPEACAVVRRAYLWAFVDHVLVIVGRAVFFLD
jgi:hypothetical protein